MLSPSEGLSADAVALYRRKGVSPACLFLQERTQLDVNVLLMAAWAGAKRKQSLDAASVQRARALVADWHREIVRPLRAVRRRLKHGPSPAPSAHTEHLRAQLQAVEISAELVELAELGKLADTPGQTVPVSESRDATEGNMLRVVEMYAGRPADPEERDAVQVIANEAMDYFS